MILYHATEAEFDTFEQQPKKDAGFHFGTLEQARMRGGPRARILEVEVQVRRARRAKDQGKWSADQIRRARKAGYDAIVYLNRYEGIPIERIQKLAEDGDLEKLDSLSDSAFRKFVPEAHDSYIVFAPEQIRILKVIPPEHAREEPEISFTP